MDHTPVFQGQVAFALYMRPCVMNIAKPTFANSDYLNSYCFTATVEYFLNVANMAHVFDVRIPASRPALAPIVHQFK